MRRAALLPAAWLAASLAVVLAELGPSALSSAVAHESEPRSLLETALFPGHALRELPHLAVLALCWAGGLAPRSDLRAAARQSARILGATALFGLALFAWASAEQGALASWLDLAQSRAAPGLEGPGVHLRFHLLSDIALAGLLFAVAVALPGAGPAPGEGDATRAPLGLTPLLGAALLAAGALASGVADVSTPRFVGHAAREVLHHSLFTAPLLVACAPGPRRLDLAGAARRPAVLAALALAAGVAGYLVALSVASDILSHSSAPGRPLHVNVAAHTFEHLLDAFFLVSVASLFGRDRGTHAGRDRAR
jgi:hypothetical protein